MMIAAAARYTHGLHSGRYESGTFVVTIRGALDLSIALLRRTFNGVELSYRAV
jgi:hypothetical protein